MKELTLSAPAKINLTLDILQRRQDGYHDMVMVMQSVTLADRIHLHIGTPGGIRAESNLHFLPNDKSNLAVAAALAFRRETNQPWRDLRIEIEKKIPVCAGTAGGSSDAAAVLKGLNTLCDTPLSPSQLYALGAEIGSDVPYCLMGGTALAEGRGEILTPLPSLPPCWIVLCKPRFSISTPALFRAWDQHRSKRRPDTSGVLTALSNGDLSGVAMRLYNVFEDVLSPTQHREIDRIKNTLVQVGAIGASMSGTGPTVLGIFPSQSLAEQAVTLLRGSYRDVFLSQPV